MKIVCGVIIFGLACILHVEPRAMPLDVLLADIAREVLSDPSFIAGSEEVKICEQKKRKMMCTIERQIHGILAVHHRGEPLEFIRFNTATCESTTPGFTIACKRDSRGQMNGYATQFSILEPVGYRAYALKRGRASTPLQEEVFTGVNEGLNVNDVRCYGKAILDNRIHAALKELRELDVRSLLNPTVLVSDATISELLLLIFIVEHIDHERFRNEPLHVLVGEVLARVAFMRDQAYKYSKSSAVALGDMQFTRPTYNMLPVKYPKARLIHDFVEGAFHSFNSLKAAALLFDHDLTRIPKKLRERVFSDQMLQIEYIASSYNGGPARPINILGKFGDLVLHNKNQENQIYILKIRKTVELFRERPELLCNRHTGTGNHDAYY